MAVRFYSISSYQKSKKKNYNQEQNAPFFIRGMVHFVERFAGAEHYKNFRQYQKASGLNMLMNNNNPVHHYKFHGGITVLNVYKN